MEFGAGCVVVGPVHVGDRARIGALALVLDDVPERGVVVGNPGRRGWRLVDTAAVR